MALKVRLKPNERMIIAGAVVANGSTAATLMIENKVPILRERDIMSPKKACSPARRIYFIVQLMYLDPDGLATHHELYWRLVGDFLKAVPASRGLIEIMSRKILADQYYEALKFACKLISYEQSILTKAGSDEVKLA